MWFNSARSVRSRVATSSHAGKLVTVPTTAVACRTPNGAVLPKPTVWVFQRGFVSMDPKSGELTTFPWGRSRIRRGSVRHTRNNVYRYTDYEFWVTRDDGATLNMKGTSGKSGEVWVLCELISKEINKLRLSQAITALQQGKRLDFDPLSLDAHRIFDGPDGLPWPEVEGITMRQGRLVIRRWSRLLAWSKTPAYEIEDLDVFLALAQALHKSAVQGRRSDPR